MTQNEHSEPTPRRAPHGMSRPVTAALLGIPTLATLGVLGIPALAATSGHGGTTAPAGAAVAATSPSLPAPGAEAAKGEALRAQAQPATTAPDADDKALEAFFAHGYGYDDAARLAKLWHAPTAGGDLGEVKVAAGRNLLAGRPVETRPDDLATAQAATQAFRQAGYGHADAVLLARLWGNGVTPDAAEVRAGQKLLRGLRPPTTPGQTASTVSQDLASEAFFAAGYSYPDAVQLAALWHERAQNGDLGPVKAEAGRKILAGIRLPVHH